MAPSAVIVEKDLLGLAGATFDLARRYRYSLWRRWDEARPVACFVCLNPSTATATVDDATVRKLVGFAKAWGGGGVVLVNLFALRSTDPARLGMVADPVGPLNDAEIARVASLDVPEIVVAWGAAPIAAPRAIAVAALLAGKKNLVCLGTNQDNSPKHPLYLPYGTTLVPWVPVTAPTAVAS